MKFPLSMKEKINLNIKEKKEEDEQNYIAIIKFVLLRGLKRVNHFLYFLFSNIYLLQKIFNLKRSKSLKTVQKKKTLVLKPNLNKEFNLSTENFSLTLKGNENVLLLCPFEHITNLQLVQNCEIYIKDIIASIQNIQIYFKQNLFSSYSLNFGTWQTQYVKNRVESCHSHLHLEIEPKYFKDFEKFGCQLTEVPHFKDDMACLNFKQLKAVFTQISEKELNDKKYITEILLILYKRWMKTTKI